MYGKVKIEIFAERIAQSIYYAVKIKIHCYPVAKINKDSSGKIISCLLLIVTGKREQISVVCMAISNNWHLQTMPNRGQLYCATAT